MQRALRGVEELLGDFLKPPARQRAITISYRFATA